jgi:hypothetical protein
VRGSGGGKEYAHGSPAIDRRVMTVSELVYRSGRLPIAAHVLPNLASKRTLTSGGLKHAAIYAVFLQAIPGRPPRLRVGLWVNVETAVDKFSGCLHDGLQRVGGSATDPGDTPESCEDCGTAPDRPGLAIKAGSLIQPCPQVIFEGSALGDSPGFEVHDVQHEGSEGEG